MRRPRPLLSVLLMLVLLVGLVPAHAAHAPHAGPVAGVAPRPAAAVEDSGQRMPCHDAGTVMPDTVVTDPAPASPHAAAADAPCCNDDARCGCACALQVAVLMPAALPPPADAPRGEPPPMSAAPAKPPALPPLIRPPIA